MSVVGEVRAAKRGTSTFLLYSYMSDKTRMFADAFMMQDFRHPTEYTKRVLGLLWLEYYRVILLRGV
jgi:hypothetical protein